jgi:hypothetical protein
MIVVPIVMESAVTRRRSALGTVIIANDGTAITGDSRNYDVRHFDATGAMRGTARVESWPSESRTVLELVAAAIKALDDYDGAPYCPAGHRTKASCDCGDIADNE